MPLRKEKLTLTKYEIVFILDPRKIEGNGESFSQGIEAFLNEIGGKINRVKCLDKRAFARPIGKVKAGVYWDYVAELPESAVAQIHDRYRLNATILRLAIFLYTDGQDDDVFKPRDEHERLVREEGFQEGYDRDERPGRNR
jgi:ribosomal protein S6